MLTTPKHKLYFKNTLYAPEHLFGPKVFVSSGEKIQAKSTAYINIWYETIEAQYKNNIKRNMIWYEK